MFKVPPASQDKNSGFIAYIFTPRGEREINFITTAFCYYSYFLVTIISRQTVQVKSLTSKFT